MADKVIVTIDEDGNTTVEVDNAVKGQGCTKLAGMFRELGKQTKAVKKPQFYDKGTTAQKVRTNG
jgi:hypothetical protein